MKVRVKRSKFSTPRNSGTTITIGFRRLLPLRDSDLESLHKQVRAHVRKLRRHYRWFFATLHLRMRGPLYVSRGIASDAEDGDQLHSYQFFTRVARKVPDLLSAIDDRLDLADFLAEGRPIWLIGLILVFFRNEQPEKQGPFNPANPPLLNTTTRKTKVTKKGRSL